MKKKIAFRVLAILLGVYLGLIIGKQLDIHLNIKNQFSQCKEITVDQAREIVEKIPEVQQYIADNKEWNAHASVMGPVNDKSSNYRVKVGRLGPTKDKPEIFSTHSWYYVDKCTGTVKNEKESDRDKQSILQKVLSDLQGEASESINKVARFEDKKV